MELRRGDYGTHSLRRTKAALIYRQTGNLRAVQILLGHTKIESTVRYLGVDIEDALAQAEGTEIRVYAGAGLSWRRQRLLGVESGHLSAAAMGICFRRSDERRHFAVGAFVMSGSSSPTVMERTMGAR